MTGQKEGQTTTLRNVRHSRGWTKDDIVAGLANLANELAEPAPRVDVNLVGKWERGDRNPGRYYAPRLCLLFDSTPEQLGFTPRPRLLASIRELRTKTIRRRHAVVTNALTAGTLVAAPDTEW